MDLAPSFLFPRMPVLNGTDVDATRTAIREYFQATFSRYELLFETLTAEQAYFVKPNSLRHPLIFYFGHTATFFINKLLLAGLLAERVDPEFEAMFAVGVDEMSWDDLDETHYRWPTVAAVRDYRRRVRATVDAIIADAPLTLPIDWDHPWWAILMAIEHERIHLETSSVLIRQQRAEWVGPHSSWPICRITGEPPRNELVAIAGGTVRLGKDRSDGIYGWDNEYGEHLAAVADFETSRCLVSNREFLAFVEADGYATDAWWEEEGLAWRRYSGSRQPPFWHLQDGIWRLRVMTELIDMPWNWPAEVNYHEARAYCNWLSAGTGKAVRLPTEDEWHRLYDVCKVTEVPSHAPTDANRHLDHWASPCPVTQFAHGELYDVAGNVWQWTETPIYPFPGFDVHTIYDDFTTPTFDGRHNLMMGGSWVSSGNASRRDARYAFRRHFFQHAGFRYVVSDNAVVPPNVYYESDKQLSEYAEFHYGDEYFGVPNFPQALARIAIAAMADKPRRKALDLGCATGRATFELARAFDEVVGVDFSARFINLGVQFSQTGSIGYSLVDEGELRAYKTRDLASLGLAEARDKVRFLQGDACNLKSGLEGFDLILAANLIDRLYEPARFLSTVHERLQPGGVLLIASPYTWLEEHTVRSNWIGGYKKNAENFTTLDGLKVLLGSHFRLMAAPQDVPFVIRETRRKFQHSLSEVTLWERIA